MVARSSACALLLGLCILRFLVAADAPTTSATHPASPQSAERTQSLERTVAACDGGLKDDPDNAYLLQQRAEALFCLGRVDDSLRDFDAVVRLMPAALPDNWQRGIALYLAGRDADGAAQFDAHQQVNPQDVENAAFHFACAARAVGGEDGPRKAQAGLIAVTDDPRPPLAHVHAMYAGKLSPADVLKAAENGPAAQRHVRLFYANYYIALWYEGCGKSKEALPHLKAAAETFSLDGYMGDVARVHWWIARGRSTPKP